MSRQIIVPNNSVNTPVTPVNNNETTTTPLVSLARIVWLIVSVISALLAFRFLFVLLGANQANGFVDFIYRISYPLASPFFGIFNYHTSYGESRVEIASLIAIVVYLLAGLLLTKLLTINRPKTNL